MERIISASLIFASVKLVTPWFQIGSDSLDLMPAIIAGPNEEYVVQGRFTAYTSYTINWETTLESPVKSMMIPDTNLEDVTRLQADDSFNCVLASKTILRFNARQGVDPGAEEYPVGTGYGYSHPRWVTGSNFIFVGTRAFPTVDAKVYRVHSDRTTDVKAFPTPGNSRAYEVLYGTGWLVISIDSTTERRLFDYTNGHEGGTNSSVQTHIKSFDSKEIGVFTPEDGRFLYVVGSMTPRRLFTVLGDGSDRLDHDLSSGLPNLHPAVWVKDSDLCVTPSWGNKFAIVNFMDLNKPTPVYYTLPGSGQGTIKAQIWSYYKAVILPFLPTTRSYVYKTLTETPCADLCATCDGIFRKDCLSCDPHSSLSEKTCSCDVGFYSIKISPTKKKCLACSQFCGTCSGPAATQCLSCRYSYMERKGDGTCGCPAGKYLSGTSCLGCDASCLTCSMPGPSMCLSCDISNGRYQSGSTCPLCDSSCSTCSGGSSSECLTCSDKGYFINSGSCSSCAAKDSTDCPVPTTINIQNEIEELNQNLTITFSPPFNSSLPTGSGLLPDTLTNKHLSLKFKRKEESRPKALTILNQRLTNQKDTSTLFIRFLEKLRFSNTEYLAVAVEAPWIYKPTTEEEEVVYLKENVVEIQIRERKQSEEDKNEEEVVQIAKASSAAIGATATATSAAVACSGSSTFFAYLSKFFNMVDILSNLASINVEHGTRLKMVIRFIEGLKIPEVEFIAKLSPIKDSEIDDPDVDAYLLRPRGTRGKMTEGNDQVFIISGQNFFMSLMIVSLWLLHSLLGLCLSEKSKIVGFVASVYQLIIGVLFFDFQMICSTEIAFFNYTKIREAPPKYILSLLISMFILTLIVSEFFRAYTIIGRRQLEAAQDYLSSNDKLVLEKYTEGLNMNYTGLHNYLVLFSNLRFFLIQIVISSLQLLNRTQAFIAMITNLAFFLFFMKMICSSVVFTSKLVFVKEVIQECCIMVALITITLFSFTGRTSFSSSIFYQVLELLAVASMIGAIGSEFLILCCSIFDSFKSCCPKKSKAPRTSDAKRSEKIDQVFDVSLRPADFGRKTNKFEKGKNWNKPNLQRCSKLEDDPICEDSSKSVPPSPKKMKGESGGRFVESEKKVEQQDRRIVKRSQSVRNREKFGTRRFGNHHPQAKRARKQIYGYGAGIGNRGSTPIFSPSLEYK